MHLKLLSKNLNLNRKWYVLVLTAISVFMPLSTWFSANAIAPDLIEELAFSTNQLAWLFNGVQLGFVIGALCISLASLADVIKPNILMAWSAIFAGIANGLLLLNLGAEMAIASRILTGFALAGIYPPSLKFISTWFSKGLGLAMGSMVGALTLGSASPHLMRSFEQSFDWEMVISVSSLICFIAASLFAFVLKQGPYEKPPTTISFSHLGRIIRNRPVMLANIGYFGHMWELYAMWGWFLSYAIIAKSNLMANWNVSFLTFTIIALGAPSCVLAGLVADRFGRALTTGICMLVSGTCSVLIGVFFDGPAVLFVIVAFLWGFTVVADSAQFSTLVSEHSEKSLIGTALAFQMGMGFAITIFVIWLVPHLVELLGGWRWAFSFLALGPFIGIIAMARLHNFENS